MGVEDERYRPDWLNVSRETLDRFEVLLDLVTKWNPRINLVSGASLGQGWTRHVLDSAQLWDVAAAEKGLWLDMGSGAGFPGLVIAAIARECAPELKMVLVEADVRKSVFLKEAIRHMGLSAEVRTARIDDCAPFQADYVSARALAPLAELLPMVARHQGRSAVAVFPKGRRSGDELEACKGKWLMASETIASRTDPDGAIIKIWDLRHA